MQNHSLGPVEDAVSPIKIPNISSTKAWDEIETVLLRHYHAPDLQAARIVYSAVAAHRLSGAPVWPMLVAPPGSMKTELLNALDGLPGTYAIDQITPKTFISGQIDDPERPNKNPSSLLKRIGTQGIILYPDFSTVLAMKSDNQAAILADMRRIFDGHLRKEFGTGEDPQKHEWKGRITFLVAVTPAIDGYYSIFQTLGERFIMVRWPRADGVEAALTAMNQRDSEKKEQLKQAVHRLFSNLPAIEPQIPLSLQKQIAALSEITVRARTHVSRNGYNKLVEYLPEPESPTRLAQQFAQLAKGSAMLDGRDHVNECDYELVKRVAGDSMPPVRAKILETLLNGKPLSSLGIPKATLSYAGEDLELVGLLKHGNLSPYAVAHLLMANVTGHTGGLVI